MSRGFVRLVTDFGIRKLPVLAVCLLACVCAFAQVTGAASDRGTGSFVEVEGSTLYYEECGTGTWRR